MGWTYFNKPANVKQWFEEQLTWENEKVKTTCLKSAVKLKEAYAAVETIHKNTDKREVWAAVFMLDYRKDPNDYYNFGYKDMDESVGPYNYNCPANILDLLTPTDSEYANKWREQCRKRLNRPKIKTGDTIKFKDPVCFGGGWSAKKFRKVQYGRKRNIFKVLDDGYGTLVRLTNSTFNQEFEIVAY